MLHLLDTNICIYLIRRQPVAVVERLEALHEGEVAMSLVTYAELRAGIEMQSRHREQDERVLSQLVALIPVLPLDLAVAEAYGRLRAAVPDRRRNAFDRLIAAHAIATNAVLVTNNEADFDGYPGLTVENWTSGR
ncbi:type II toxin-antitoxin system VapC family toxin [Nevskia sp.]|uniref:type II toxin-antitoxin system VapC family toxin n=1 Tax=Nevskia sp. TaxID=1929292 RepID=UPI0025F69BAD|nr:type II toxin-antitoxin system VapC family toxin [Nevskia sp.]